MPRGWGCCSPRARICTTPTAHPWSDGPDQLPMHLIDYVIAHELAHVKLAGHREDFWMGEIR
ncbi:YgjP-like metallopeptidase domain-containing protein [Streptomyces gilvus]|uniref:YgjP-like metallopeptidase domain-containing protein n=1 Tax=Streptomyces gilvus TaxID=2920937 RepID=UPI0027E48B02|nr:YgjP-like metallopeptidase domain-containing protein [Streptomyces sp. CME 23]